MPSPIAQGVDLRPVPFEDLSKTELVAAIAHAVGPAESFVGLNAHSVYLAERDAEFRAVLAESRRFCDGFGTHLLAILQGVPKPRHRNTPTDFMWDVFARCAESGKTVYLLGDEPGIAERFAHMLEERHPGLVCGVHHGFFQFGSEEEAAIVKEINERQPHLLCVGMGQPRQEIWTHRLKSELQCAAVFQIGASMAFAVGARQRGPAWATDHGLEWLFRVLSEPRKMFSRYFVEIPWLISRALLYRLKK